MASSTINIRDDLDKRDELDAICIVPYRVRDARVELLAVPHYAWQWPKSFGTT